MPKGGEGADEFQAYCAERGGYIGMLSAKSLDLSVF